jgi:hypothetical protein
MRINPAALGDDRIFQHHGLFHVASRTAMMRQQRDTDAHQKPQSIRWRSIPSALFRTSIEIARM